MIVVLRLDVWPVSKWKIAIFGTEFRSHIFILGQKSVADLGVVHLGLDRCKFNKVFTQSSKRPANFQQMCSDVCWVV